VTEARLSGQVAVVTGASRGIGRAIARELAGAGAACAVGGRDREGLAATCAELKEARQRTMWAECDVRQASSVERFGDAVLAAFHRVDIVVANAGSVGPIAPSHEVDPADWQDCIDTNLTGIFLTFRRFIPTLLAQRSGSLIAVSSVTGKRPLERRGAYAAAKMGSIGLVRTLALELGPFGIRVNSLCPGSVAGERLDRLIADEAIMSDLTFDEAARRHLEPSALGRLVTEEEVARACLFLAGPESTGITGEDLNVSAGAVMY